ncbi:Hypothetical predicted protein [Cloeon dipterum]|uniref:Uncharacterized protein n=1 Tax=Cloeon dipterum TaxID=197152 RepID=A0A8S1C7Z7_9INSE|nr:Hypothetical predicted protein [Cloeon dipterum]
MERDTRLSYRIACTLYAEVLSSVTRAPQVLNRWIIQLRLFHVKSLHNIAQKGAHCTIEIYGVLMARFDKEDIRTEAVSLQMLKPALTDAFNCFGGKKSSLHCTFCQFRRFRTTGGFHTFIASSLLAKSAPQAFQNFLILYHAEKKDKNAPGGVENIRDIPVHVGTTDNGAKDFSDPGKADQY